MPLEVCKAFGTEGVNPYVGEWYAHIPLHLKILLASGTLVYQ